MVIRNLELHILLNYSNVFIRSTVCLDQLFSILVAQCRLLACIELDPRFSISYRQDLLPSLRELSIYRSCRGGPDPFNTTINQ